MENGFIRDYESTLVFFNNLEEELPNIDEWFSLKNSVQILCKNGLEDFLKKIDTKRDQSSNLVNIFLKGFFSDLLSKFYEEDKILGMLSKQERLSLIEEFKKLDIKQQSIARHRLVSHLESKMPEIDVVQVESAETSILMREISKKRRNKSIRRLFSEIPNLIKVLKPCMMMSPLSVSIFLDPQFFKFDVVIFDEASQVFPEDAVGAIMRGKQIVVVGDNKQLPPTSFFKVSETEAELEDHEEDLESLESILDECMTAGLPQKSLLWHYRSKHESLIAFSNYHFYKNRLNTFPSSIFDGQDSGIDFCYVENGVYDRSKSRKNKIEAMKVAEMVLKHAQNKPNVSLGVVAFSEAQQTAILDQLEVLRRENPSLEEFFREDKPEEFFVKNLENVQGDERDEMIFSTGYGKDNTGKLTMNFGPLNKSGGERRLNVAITRARQKVTVVSSIKASDISSEVTNPGVKALREYLMYAENGGLKEFLANKAEYTGGDFESPFEESVYDELTEIGLTLHKQVGCSGYRIDLAVVDTENPGRYLLGIECDGAMYHSAKTARDRDRLRQQVLENLGWKIIRIWSRDWFLDKKSEVKRILEAVEEARAISNGEKIIKSIEDSEYFESEFPKIESTMQPIATYEKFSHEDSQKMHTFTQLIDGIIQKEAPIHIDELLSRIMEMYKYNGFYNISEVPDFFTDSGNISNKKLRNFVENYVRKNYNLSDKFILNTDKEIKPRRVLNNKEKLEHDHIYNLEIQKAIKLILEKVFSVNSNDLVKSVAAFFGYSRAGERIRRRILEEISELIIKNEIVSNNEKLTLPENVIGNTDKSANMKFMNRYKLSKPKSGKAKTVKSLKAGPVFTISPDGKYIFSGHDNEVEVIVFATKQRLKFTLDGHKYFVTSVVISPNGKCIVTSSNDKKIIVWKLSSNNSMSKHDMYDYILDGHDDAVCSTAISQDGKYLVSGSEDKTVKIWDLINYVEMRTLRGHDNIVHSVKISPIKNYVISGSWDETIKIWDIITGKEIRTLTGHKGAIYSLAISPGGNYLASGSLDETIKIWDITTGKEEHTLTGHKGVIYSLAISPDGNYLVSGSWDKTIKIWDIATGKEEHTLTGHESEIYSLAFSPDERYLISGSEDRTMKIWDWKQLILS